MNLRQLRYFLTVVEQGNITRAAEQLHIAQPALGTQIRQLEEDLGVALLIRHSRGVDPTYAGKLLHQRAGEILEKVEAARREITDTTATKRETVRLGLTPSLMPIVGPEIAVNVRERLPNISLQLIEEMSHVQFDALTDGKIDAALAYDIPELDGHSRIAVFHEDLVLVTPPSLDGGKTVYLSDALEETLVLPEEGDSVRSSVERAARECGLTLNIAYEVRSVAAIRQLVARGAAAGILPFASVHADVTSGRLIARKIINPSIRRTLFIGFSRKQGKLNCELALTGVIRASLTALDEILGHLGQPLLPHDP